MQAQIRVCLVIDVQLKATNLDEALQQAKELRIGHLVKPVGTSNSINDFTVDVVSVMTDKWVD